MRADAIRGVMGRLLFDKENKRYTLNLDILESFIAELDGKGILGWSDRQRFVFERDPENYLRRLFNNASFNNIPVVII